MKKPILLSLVLLYAIASQSQTIINTDSISGHWGRDIYIITRNTVIPKDDALFIESGSQIRFAGYYSLKIDGKLIAKGNKKQPIVFCYADSSDISNYKNQCDTTVQLTDGWKGLRFSTLRNEKDTSLLVYCKISGVRALTGRGEDCTGAISIEGPSSIAIKHCIISGNKAHLGAAIFCNNAKPMIYGNVIEDNYSVSNGGAIFINASMPIFKNNLLRRNVSSEFGGAICFRQSSGSLVNNTITQNEARFGGAMSLVRSNIRLINNTIAENMVTENGGGIHCEQASPFIKNTIIWGNTSGQNGKQIYLYEMAFPDIEYSNIQGGITSIEYFSDSLNAVSRYKNNFDEDPGFVINDTSYYSLKENSPCIDAGLNEDQGFTERFDMNGHPRIHNGIIDLGAQEQITGMDDQLDDLVEDIAFNTGNNQSGIRLFPNPSTGSFTLNITSEDKQIDFLEIMNINGQILYSQSLNTSYPSSQVIEPSLSRGHYLVRLKNSRGEIVYLEKLIIE